MKCSRLEPLLAPFAPFLGLLLVLALLFIILRALLGLRLGLKPLALAVVVLLVVGSVGSSSKVGATGSKPDSCKQAYLYRFGLAWESRDSLEAEAHKAVKNGFPHGVSTFSRSSRPDAMRASLAEVEAYFRVIKTGGNPYHYTVELPDPLTNEAASKFNRLFGRTR